MDNSRALAGQLFTDVKEDSTTGIKPEFKAEKPARTHWDMLLERKGQDRPDYFAQATARGLGNPNWSEQNVKEEQVG